MNNFTALMPTFSIHPTILTKNCSGRRPDILNKLKLLGNPKILIYEKGVQFLLILSLVSHQGESNKKKKKPGFPPTLFESER
jgi:hypothetical protein